MGLLDRWRKPRPTGQTRFLEQVSEATAHIPIAECVPRLSVTVVGVVESVRAPSDKASGFAVTVSDGTGSIDLVWRNRRTWPQLSPGNVVVASGTVAVGLKSLELIDPKYSIQVEQ